MTRLTAISTAVATVALAALLAGCGGSATSAPATTRAATFTASPPPAIPSTTAPVVTTGLGPLQAEATAAAAGDIPDNQVFLTYRNPTAGYSMKYPEGWAQQGSGSTVTFRDKNNIVRIVVEHGSAPNAVSVRRDLSTLQHARVESSPHAVTISGRPAFAATYSTTSAPNPVTGKRVDLVADRYYLWTAGKRAVVDLGTPRGVDNVDAYRLMIESFRWS